MKESVESDRIKLIQMLGIIIKLRLRYMKDYAALMERFTTKLEQIARWNLASSVENVENKNIKFKSRQDAQKKLTFHVDI